VILRRIKSAHYENEMGGKRPLDNIPRCVYMVSIYSKKEAVIAKPHLFS
jgi:hypothetical protein